MKKIGPKWDLIEKICNQEIDVEILLSRPDLIALMMPIAEEWWRRVNHNGYKYVPDDHIRRDQLGFHKSNSMVRICAGGNQSGKSKAGAQEIKWWLEGTHPYRKTPIPAKIWIISASFINIYEGVYRHLMGEDPILFDWEIERIGPQVVDVAMPRWIRMKNGSVVSFHSAEGGEKARKRFAAAAVDFVLIDEEIDEASWVEIKMRLLSKGGSVAITTTFVESYEWLCKLEDRAESGDSDIKLWRFNTSRALECGHIKKRQYDNIFSDMSEDEKHVRHEGYSRKRQGLVYQEFSAQFHICKPFEIPSDWTRYFGMDPGWNTCCVIWLAVSPQSRIYFYRHLYVHNLTHREIASQIRHAEGYRFLGTKEIAMDGAAGVMYEKDLWEEVQGETEHIEMRVIDPSAFGTTVEGYLKIGTLMASQHDLSFSPALSDVAVGIECVKQGLRVNEQLDPPQARFQFFADLTEVFTEFRSYRWPKERTSTTDNRRLDKPIKRRDHAMDVIKYLSMLNPMYVDPQLREETEQEEYLYDHLVGKDVNEIRRREFLMRKRESEGIEQGEHAGGLGTIY